MQRPVRVFEAQETDATSKRGEEGSRKEGIKGDVETIP